MRVFVAGIIQGGRSDMNVHDEDYRGFVFQPGSAKGARRPVRSVMSFSAVHQSFVT